MAYDLLILNEKIWLKDLSELDAREATRIWEKIEALSEEPWPASLQVKKLRAYHIAHFRLRVGRYRVLFDRNLETKQIILYRILHRSKLY